MNGTRFRTLDKQVLTAERLDSSTLVDGSIHQLEGKLWHLQQRKRFNDSHIHQSVPHGCLRSDKRIVAPLRSIRTSNQESLIYLLLAFLIHQLNLVCFRIIRKSILKNIFHVSEESTLSSFSKFLRDKSIQPHSTSAEERMQIDQSIVHQLRFSLVNQLDGTNGIHRNMQMSSQSVTRTTRDDGKRRVRMHQCPSRFVHRSIPTYGAHNIHTSIGSTTGNFRGMSRILSLNNVVCKLIFINKFLNLLQYHLLSRSAGNRIHNEDNSLQFLHTLSPIDKRS